MRAPLLCEPPQCDYLLFVAAPSELRALKQEADISDKPWSRPADPSGRALVEGVGRFFDLGTIGVSRVVAVQTAIGALGSRGSTWAAHFYLQKTGAEGIFCVGMAFGSDRGLQPPGTVLISEKLFPYDERTVRPDGDAGFLYEYDPRMSARPCKESLLRVLREHDRRRSTPAGAFKIEFGTLISGSATIQSKAYLDRLRRWLPVPFIGGEMEGVGLLPLGQPVPGVVVKGICDYAEDDQRNEVKQHREAACGNAIRVVLDAIEGWNPAHAAV